MKGGLLATFYMFYVRLYSNGGEFSQIAADMARHNK
jgi:hypothetical protein